MNNNDPSEDVSAVLAAALAAVVVIYLTWHFSESTTNKQK
jgi:hypothetical protein